MGNYEIREPDSLQIQSIIRLSAFLCNEYQVNPDSIRGHKDYTETLCPGKNLYRFLENGTIAEAVKNAMMD
jgi:N-acetylmuramoyl-L-alanine amidase CwlA